MTQLKNPKDLQKGDSVRVENNEIFKMMGYKTVTGAVFMLRADGSGFALKCKETGAMETVDFGDGEIYIINNKK